MANHGWDYFIGPCVHGRDPYTRCEICDEDQELAKAAASGDIAARAKLVEIAISRVPDFAELLAALRAQLAESAAREVQLRAELTNTRASIHSLIVEAKTLRGISSHAVITFGGVMIGDIDRGLAAPPSTAAAELQTLRALEIECADHQCAATGEIQNEGGDRSCGICDALAVVAVARAGTP